MCGSMLSRGRPKLLALSLLALTAGAAHAQLSGAIFTTLPNGQTVNANIYTNIKDVYLNGGPQNTNGAGLQDGIYFFQVTNPNGHDLLSTTKATDRFIVVNNGRFEGRSDFYGTPGNHMSGGVNITPHPESAGPSPNGGIGVQLYPFNQTTNTGGEYKAWLILYRKDSDPTSGKNYSDPTTYSGVELDGLHIDFAHRWAKTDNFKIKPPKNHFTQKYSLSGTKFFDVNENGLLDSNEHPIAGFIIKIVLGGASSGTFYFTTDSNGFWSTPQYPSGTTFVVTELLPQNDDPSSPLYGSTASKKWMQTAPGTQNDPPGGYSGTIVDKNINDLNFGNTQVITLSGLKFYDKNDDGSYQSASEPTIANWPIDVTIDYPDNSQPQTFHLHTDSNGVWTLPNIPVESSYSASEIQGGGAWLQTAPAGNKLADTILVGDPPYTVAYNQGDVTGLNFGNIQQGQLTGRKFYDTNADGKEESGEPGIQNFKIEIDYILPGQATPKTDFEITDAQGNWTSILLPDGTSYVVKEVLPPTGNWHQSFPSPGGTYSGTITGPGVTITPGYTIPPVTGLDFGNYVPVSINAKTKGFWHNQNGYAAMDDGGTIVPELQMLNALCLVRLDGSPADFDTNNPSAGFTDFSNWITNDSNGSNMACQLSAQLAAMELNVEAGYVSGDQLIFAPGASSSNSLGIAKLTDLMAEANSWICANPITVVSSAARTHQTTLEQALDNGNNNLNWVGTPIIIVSPY